MAYIGKTPITGNFVKLDAISVVNGQAGYTMNNGGSAFTDYENVNQFLVSLNGILQAPTTSFTVSGSTLTFASNLATGDVIDFVMVLGNTLDIGTPSDATVTNAKTNFTSTSSAAGLQIKGDGTTDGTLQLNCSQNSHGIKLASPAHSAGQSYTVKFPTGNITADKFLKVASITGSGTSAVGQLSFADAGGAFTLLSTSTISSAVAQVDITSNIDSTYKDYMFVISDLHTATDDVRIRAAAFSSAGSPDIGTNKYSYGGSGHNSANSNLDMNSAGNDYAEITLAGLGNASNESGNFVIYMFNASGTSRYTNFHTLVQMMDTSGRSCVGEVGFLYRENFAVTGMRFYASSGNLDSGVIKLYGIS